MPIGSGATPALIYGWKDLSPGAFTVPDRSMATSFLTPPPSSPSPAVDCDVVFSVPADADGGVCLREEERRIYQYLTNTSPASPHPHHHHQSTPEEKKKSSISLSARSSIPQPSKEERSCQYIIALFIYLYILPLSAAFIRS